MTTNTDTIDARPTLFMLRAGEIIGAPFALRVFERMTADEFEQNGRPNVARAMREQNQTAELLCQRGTGSKIHIVREYAPLGPALYVYEQAI